MGHLNCTYMESLKQAPPSILEQSEAKCVDSGEIAENSLNATEVPCTTQARRDGFGHKVSRPPSAREE